MASYARNHETFTEQGLGFVAVSVDDVERNRAMVEKLILPFPLLADPGAAVIQEWGVYNEPERIAQPAVFMVLRNRRVVLRYVGTDFEDRPSNAQVLAVLSETE